MTAVATGPWSIATQEPRQGLIYCMSSAASLQVTGTVNGMPCTMVVDTGAMVTLVRWGLVLVEPGKESTCISVTGEEVPVDGQANVWAGLASGGTRQHTVYTV